MGDKLVYSEEANVVDASGRENINTEREHALSQIQSEEKVGPQEQTDASPNPLNQFY